MRLEREKARYLTINVTNLIRDPGGPRTCVSRKTGQMQCLFLLELDKKILISKNLQVSTRKMYEQ